MDIFFLCLGTSEGDDTEPYAKNKDAAGKPQLKVGEEDIPDTRVRTKKKAVRVSIVKSPLATVIDDEEVAVENLHSVERSCSKLIDLSGSDEGEPEPKIPTPTDRMTRARAKEVAEDVQSQKKKAEKAKRKVGGAAKKGRK